jgi:hypothetical protein
MTDEQLHSGGFLEHAQLADRLAGAVNYSSLSGKTT